MTWEVERVARLEVRPEAGGLHVVGVSALRECGCEVVLGMRLDEQEPTLGAIPCDAHGAEAKRALAVFAGMPPSDEEAVSLLQRLLDAEVAA